MNQQVDSNKEDMTEFNHSKTWKRTNFFVSVSYLLIQVLIPGLTLYFLSSRDFSFSFETPLWLMFVLALSLILFTIMTTIIVYKLKGHQLDQFTYALPFTFFILGFYLSSYWLDYHYFLVRFIIAFALAIIGIFLTSLVLLLYIRKKNKQVLED